MAAITSPSCREMVRTARAITFQAGEALLPHLQARHSMTADRTAGLRVEARATQGALPRTRHPAAAPLHPVAEVRPRPLPAQLRTILRLLVRSKFVPGLSLQPTQKIWLKAFCSLAALYCSPVQSEDILTIKPPDPDMRLPYGHDSNQFVDVRIPNSKGPHPVVFFIHGGYWRAKYDLTYAGHLCGALKKLGIVSWNVEYRRVGNPGGGWPGTFEDIRSAYRRLHHPDRKTAALDLKRVCVAGHSAGGQLALCLAAHEPTVRNVLSLAGVLDLHRGWELHLSNDAVAGFLGGSPTEVPDHYREASPAEQRITATQKLIHGTADDSVPYEISKNYAQQKKRAGENVDVLTLEQTGHFEIVDPASAVWKQVQKALVSLTAA